jgi:hypothetical protein
MSNLASAYGQNIVDISIMATGSVEGLFDLCQANNLMPDADIAIGQILVIPDAVDSDMLVYLGEENITIATGQDYTVTATARAFSAGFSGGFS